MKVGLLFILNDVVLSPRIHVADCDEDVITLLKKVEFVRSHKVRPLIFAYLLDDLRPHLVRDVPVVIIFLFLPIVLFLVGFQLIIALNTIAAVARLFHILNDVDLLFIHKASKLINRDHWLATPVIELSI